MRPWAHAADAGRDACHFLDRFADAELLEAAQFDDIDARISHVASIIQLDGDFGMAFDSTDRLNNECFAHGLPLWCAPQAAFCACETIELRRSVRNLSGV